MAMAKGKKKAAKKKKTQVAKKSPWRPTKYRKELDEEVYRLAMLGLDDNAIAKEFEIVTSTLNLWKLEYPSFSESLKMGKTKADAKVAVKLYDRALGAEWTEEAAFKVKNQTAPGIFTEEVVTVPLRRAAPPDTAAASLWLRNRKSLYWKDKPDTEVKIDINITNAEHEIGVLGTDKLLTIRGLISANATDAEYQEVE